MAIRRIPTDTIWQIVEVKIGNKVKKFRVPDFSKMRNAVRRKTRAE
jgi:hypothetical protein